MALVLVACGSSNDSRGTSDTTARTSSTTAAARTKADFAGTVDISGGRKMYLECSGTGSPIVVLVSGQRGSAQEWHMTESRATPPVFGEVAKTNRVCAYDRPGTPVGDQLSRSDPALQPTTATAGVSDLHAMLAAAGEAGPYVLVGHSAGGMIVRLYASTYPEDVQGMVLVDALSEYLQDYMTPDQWKIQRLLLQGDIRADVAIYPDLERFDADISFSQLRAAPGLHPMPLIVLSADERIGPRFAGMIAAGQVPAGVPPAFGYVLDDAQAKAQLKLSQLVSGAIRVADTHSGHNIHRIQPQLVVDSIRQVVDAGRHQN